LRLPTLSHRLRRGLLPVPPVITKQQFARCPYERFFVPFVLSEERNIMVEFAFDFDLLLPALGTDRI
jgi:hypothetical protein